MENMAEEERYYLIAAVCENDWVGPKLLGDFGTPEEAEERINEILEGGYLGAPTLWRPLNIFLIKGKRIPVKVKEVAVVVIEDEE